VSDAIGLLHPTFSIRNRRAVNKHYRFGLLLS
jgi:hypothetical protein